MSDLIEKLDELTDLKIEYYKNKKKFDRENEAIINRMKELQSDLKEELVGLGQSVKTDRIMVTYSSGKVIWNDDFLSGYAISHPEILQAKKTGEPFVTFRLLDYKHIN